MSNTVIPVTPVEPMKDTTQGFFFSVYAARQRAIEAALRESITLIEGRTPEPAEIAEHGKHFIWPDGHEEYHWRGKMVVGVAGSLDTKGEAVVMRYRQGEQ